MALFSLGEYEAAKDAFELGQSLDPNNSQFRTWIRKCNTELETEATNKPATVVDTPKPVPATLPTPTVETTRPVQEAKPEPKFR
jgi:suppressor of G2 allele of SKP1